MKCINRMMNKIFSLFFLFDARSPLRYEAYESSGILAATF